MKLSQTVLDVVRSASGAAVALAIGCSSSHAAPIRSEPSARLAPIAVAPAAPLVSPPAVPTAVAPPAIATLEPAPPAPPTTVADAADAGVHHRRRRRVDPYAGTIGTNVPIDVMANCGRG